MNDDFLKRSRREPRPEFRKALYERITMETATVSTRPRQHARAIALVLAVLVALLLTPQGQAFANQLLASIGVFTITQGPPPADVVQPTAAPPVAIQTEYAADAATASSLAGFTVFDLNLPAAYAPVGAWAIVPQGTGVNVIREYRNPDGQQITINQLKHDGTGIYEDRLSPQEQATTVAINDATGILIEGRLLGVGTRPNGEPELKPTTWLKWAAQGVTYTLFSDGLSAEQLISIAQSMH